MRGRRCCLIAVVVSAITMCASSAALAGGDADPSLTPGAKNPAVSQATIATTICRVGYTKTVRNVSNATKSQVYAEYRVAQAQKRLYVIDHLVPLEVGGANAITNLWSELKDDAKRKDRVEGELHARVCSGAEDLTTAQRAFESVWSTALATAPVPPTEAPPPQTEAPTEPPATEAPVAPGGGATAICNDGTYSTPRTIKVPARHTAASRSSTSSGFRRVRSRLVPRQASRTPCALQWSEPQAAS